MWLLKVYFATVIISLACSVVFTALLGRLFLRRLGKAYGRKLKYSAILIPLAAVSLLPVIRGLFFIAASWIALAPEQTVLDALGKGSK